jgi:DNA-binding beta-propeller fold protein YncE
MGLVVDPEAAVPGWGFETGIDDFGLISTVATDSDGGVYVLSRVPKGALHRFDADGNWLGDWEFPFPAPHGLWISPDDRVFVTDTSEHVVRIFDRDGNLLQTIGTPGQKGEPGKPFNLPTRAVQGPSGDIYVSDGYGQNWVHRFSADGNLILSWGGDGSEPGEFQTPHAIWVDADERVYVVDRANGRVQVFDNAGTVLAIWDGFCFPHDIYQTASGTFIVTDCATREDDSRPYHEQMPEHPLIELTADGQRVGATGASGLGPGEFPDCPHSVWISPAGDVYVTEVVSHNRLQKFEARQ